MKTDIDKKIDEMVEIAHLIHERLPKGMSLRDVFKDCDLSKTPVPPECVFPMDYRYEEKV